MKIEVKITKEVLEATKMCDSNTWSVKENCAISYAVREIFPDARVGIDNSDWLIRPFKCAFRTNNDMILPKHVGMFIRKFDKATPEERVKMKPFSFVVDVLQEVIDTINIEEAKEILKQSETLKLIEV